MLRDVDNKSICDQWSSSSDFGFVKKELQETLCIEES